jgi:hypothetical protein
MTRISRTCIALPLLVPVSPPGSGIALIRAPRMIGRSAITPFGGAGAARTATANGCSACAGAVMYLERYTERWYSPAQSRSAVRHHDYRAPVLSQAGHHLHHRHVQARVPVVMSDIEVLAEVAGPVALMVPPRDVGGWTSALVAVLGDAALSGQLTDAGRAVAVAAGWDHGATALSRLLSAVASRRLSRSRITSPWLDGCAVEATLGSTAR